MDDENERPRRRWTALWIVLAVFAATYVIDVEIGRGTAHWESETSLSAPNAEDESRVLSANDVAFVLVDDRAITREIADAAARGLAERAPWLGITTGATEDGAYSSDPLADVIVLVDTPLHVRTPIVVASHDTVETYIAIGATPHRIMDADDSPLHGLRGEVEIRGSTDFYGLHSAGTRREELVAGVVERWESLIDEFEFVEAARGDEGGTERAAPWASTTPPLEIAGDVRAIYAGHRRDGSFEALWHVETEGSHTRAMEDLVASAEADGWTPVIRRRSAVERLVAISFLKDGDEVQVMPARMESSVRESPDARDVLAIVLYRAP